MLSRVFGFGRRSFDSLSEQEVLALAISSEEDDGRIYRAYADGLRDTYPNSAAIFDDMAEEEDSHRAALIELHRSRFGERIPLIRREHVRGYYDRDGRAPYEGGWRKPIKDAPRTSPWNPHRVNPVLHKVMPHQGTDFGSPVGTPIGASSFGTVSFTSPSRVAKGTLAPCAASHGATLRWAMRSLPSTTVKRGCGASFTLR